MNKEDAEKVLKIMLTADGGCIYCARDLFNRFISEFGEFAELARNIFRKAFDEDLEKEEDPWAKWKAKKHC
ncbi:MAG: hypothetical protein ACTSSJ_01840 [Candidatus Odinarchaeia archaeon]